MSFRDAIGLRDPEPLQLQVLRKAVPERGGVLDDEDEGWVVAP